ncbi:MAG: hypothetical protein KAX49_09155 [Halanaerobiales bacterium]|nr:hypothetical protein [Halanaerobiales bacterium]
MESIKKYIYSQLASNQLSNIEAMTMLKELHNFTKAKESQTEDIAIIGVACRFAEAEDKDQFWQLLKEGKDSIRKLPKARDENIDEYLKLTGLSRDEVIIREGGYLEDIDRFDPNFFGISAREASLMDPNQRIFLETAWQAVEDAGYGGTKLAGSNTGVFVGHSHDFGDDYKKLIQKYSPELLSLATLGNINAVITGRLSYLLDLTGPSMLVDTACSSALLAVHLASTSIKNGDCEMAIAGGVKVWLIPAEPKDAGEFGGGFGPGIGIEAKDGRARSFDDNTTGTGFGEGVGVLLLKPLKKALADGDSIYAVIKGSATNQDGKSIGISAPNLQAQEGVIQKAWKRAGIHPETISYIEAHGTGTKLGDPIEIYALQNSFAKHTKKKHFCAVGSVKTNVGHLDNAAGIVGLIKVILALKNREIPASLHFEKPNREIDFLNSPVYVNAKLNHWNVESGPRRAGISAFGLSGTNVHMILEEAPKLEKESQTDESKVNILTISAKSEEVLKDIISKYITFLESEKEICLAHLCFTANTGRNHYSYRLALIVEGREDLMSQLKRLYKFKFEKVADGQRIYYGNVKNSKNVMEKVDLKEDSYEKIARSYVSGAEIAWDEIYKGQKLRRINIPVYQFDRKKCWVKPSEMMLARKEVAVSAENMDLLNQILNKSDKEDIVKGILAMIGERNKSHERSFKRVTNVVIKEDDPDLGEDERKLAGIWAEVLGLEEVSIYDSFYDLGGDSIIALTLMSKISKEFNIELSLDQIFRNPTIAEISKQVLKQNTNSTSNKISFKKIPRRREGK